MFIKKIKLHNFKSFGEEEIEFRDFNVLVGANASGKSNVVEALRFLRNLSENNIENALSMSGGADNISNFKSGGRFSIYLNFIPTKRKYKFRQNKIEHKSISYYFEFNKDKFSEVVIVKFDLLLETNNNTPIEYYFEIKHINREKVEIEIKSEKGYENLEFEENFKELLGFLSNINDTYPDSLITSLYRNFFSDLSGIYLYDFDLKAAKESNRNFSIDELQSNGSNLAVVLKEILSKTEERSEFLSLIYDILPFVKDISLEKNIDNSLQLQLYESYSNKNIPSFLLSDGTIAITLLITALFFEYYKLAIFEEPEKGLHPSLIALIMDYFYEAARDKQIIITTHNPEIIKHTKIEDLLLVSRDENGFSKVSRPAEKEMVKAFLENDLGLSYLFVHNLLDN